MDVAAKISSKGQVTIPKAVREALGVNEGDAVLFRIEGTRAVLARTVNFLELAGMFSTPTAQRNVAWDQIVKVTRATRAKQRH